MTRETINNEDRGVSLKSVKHILYEVCLHYGNKEIFGKLLERVDKLRDWEEYQALEQESKTEKVIKMRDATPEERESIDKYIKSISKPTGVDFWDLEQEPSGDVISRQDAIKAIDEKAKRIKNEDTLNGLAGAVGILFDLPSYNSIKTELSGDAVSRQAVDTLVDELARAISDERCCMSRGRSIATIMQDILDLPSVKPQEKTGHWIYKTMEGQFCSICGEQSVWKFNYCPNCGCRMVESQESEDKE